MFQNIKVLNSVDKVASNGKPYKALEVQDEAGTVFKVNIFNDFPDFANVKEGSVLRGQLVQKGQYTNLLSETQNKPRGSSGAFKQKVIEESMERKETSIKVAQENRADGIKVSATMRDAVQCAIVAYGKDPTRLNTLEDEIIYWRKWLWKHWEDPQTEAIYPD